MGCDGSDGIEAALRRVTLERDEARWTIAALKVQHKTLRQRLRREQADHQQTLMRLETLRAELSNLRELS